MHYLHSIYPITHTRIWNEIFAYNCISWEMIKVHFMIQCYRVEVPMMQAQLELPMGYSEELEARTLELPLSERRMSMFVILPDYLDPGIHQLEANFTTDHVRALMSTLEVLLTIYLIQNLNINNNSSIILTRKRW